MNHKSSKQLRVESQEFANSELGKINPLSQMGSGLISYSK